jgi:preprotein translocase subunit YajC
MAPERGAMLENWLLAQVFAFGALMSFSSYLTYRQKTKRMKKFKRTQAIVI